MTPYFRFIIRFRWFVLLGVFLLTLAAGLMTSRGVIASSIGKMVLGESPDYIRYLDRLRVFGSSDVLIVAYHDPETFSEKSQNRLRKAVAGVQAIKTIKGVHSLLDVQRIYGSEDTLTINTYANLYLEDPNHSAWIIDEVRNDPLAGGYLISNDGNYSAVIIELDAESDIAAEKGPELLADILEAFQKAGFSRNTLHPVGFPASMSAIIVETYFNLKRLFPIVCIVLLIAVWVMFRRLWPVALTMLVASIAVIWTMGFLVMLDPQISAFASMIPAVILIISFSDVIHLCSAYLLELGRGLSKEDAIMASGTDVGKACLLTSMTTFLGFVAMSFVPAPVFRQLGIVLGFGVAVALILAVTLTPILFSIIPRPKPWRRGATGKLQGQLDRFLTGVNSLTTHQPWLVIGAFVLLVLVSIVGLNRMKIETDFSERLGVDHPVRADERIFRGHFNGSTSLDIFVETKEKDGVLNPELLNSIVELQDEITHLPEVTHAFSLVNLMETLHEELTVDEQRKVRLPETKAALAQYLLLFEMSGGDNLDRFLDSDRQTMKMSLQLSVNAVRSVYETGIKVERLAKDILDPSMKLEVTGLVYLMGQWLDEIIAGQRRGLLFAVLTIAVTMMIGLRSFRVGLWSMIPNILPLLVLGGYLGLFWKHVDSDVLAVAMIAIGIGVDDTIHFLARFRTESRRHFNVSEAIERTYHFSGRGIVITSIILVAGFSPFAASDYLSIKMMGTLLPMTLVTALLADLFLVPAMVQIGAIRFPLAKANPGD